MLLRQKRKRPTALCTAGIVNECANYDAQTAVLGREESNNRRKEHSLLAFFIPARDINSLKKKPQQLSLGNQRRRPVDVRPRRGEGGAYRVSMSRLLSSCTIWWRYKAVQSKIHMAFTRKRCTLLLCCFAFRTDRWCTQCIRV